MTLVQVGIGNRIAVLRRDDDGIHAHRAVAVIFHRDLRLAVGPQKVDNSLAANLREPLHQFVRQSDRQRHQFFGLIAGETEHQSLIARASGVHAHGDVRGLPLDRGNHGAGVRVEAILGARVADVADDVARNIGIIEHGLGGNFSGDHHQAGRHQRFARHAPEWIFGEHRVEYRVGNLIGNLVRDDPSVTDSDVNRNLRLFSLKPAPLLRESARIDQLKFFEAISILSKSTLTCG